VLDSLRRASQQILTVGRVTRRVPLRNDDPRGDPRHHELRRQRQVPGIKRIDHVVPGDDVEGRVEHVGARAELVTSRDTDVHRDRPGESVAEVEDAGDPAAVGEQVLAVEVGVNDLRRRLGQDRADYGVEPVDTVREPRSQPTARNPGRDVGAKRPLDVRQHAAGRQFVEQRPEPPQVLQVPQMGPLRPRVA